MFPPWHTQGDVHKGGRAEHHLYKGENMRIIYSKGNFNIYRSRYKKCGYIIHNNDKEFKDGHTHIQSFRVAKEIVNSAIKNKVPKHFSIYFLVSLIRISTDDEYISRIRKQINKKNKECRKGRVKNEKS